MKTCIIFGNCQCSGIRKFLEFSNFYEEYQIYQYANWELIQNDTMTIPIHQLKNADLIIYQPLSDVYNCYSTNKSSPNSFFNLLSEDCNTISFPRIHNNAIFPVFHKHRPQTSLYGNIKNLPSSMNELLYMYDNNLLDFDFNNRMLHNYTISKEKEENCNIKIIDFMCDNIKKEKLFLTHEHPTSFVFNKITSDICNILELEYDYEKGLKQEENITGLPDSVYLNKNCQYPISRYSINHFGFEYIKTEDTIANTFYRNIIQDYFIKTKQVQ